MRRALARGCSGHRQSEEGNGWIVDGAHVKLITAHDDNYNSFGQGHKLLNILWIGETTNRTIKYQFQSHNRIKAYDEPWVFEIFCHVQPSYSFDCYFNESAIATPANHPLVQQC